MFCKIFCFFLPSQQNQLYLHRYRSEPFLKRKKMILFSPADCPMYSNLSLKKNSIRKRSRSDDTFEKDIFEGTNSLCCLGTFGKFKRKQIY